MDDFFARAQLAKLHCDRLTREARTCTDPDRLAAINDEMEVVVRSLEDIRAEQILHYIPKAKPARRRWRLFGRRPATGGGC